MSELVRSPDPGRQAIFTGAVLVIAAIIALGVWVIHSRTSFSHRCEAQGGAAHEVGRGLVCVRDGMVIFP